MPAKPTAVLVTEAPAPNPLCSVRDFNNEAWPLVSFPFLNICSIKPTPVVFYALSMNLPAVTISICDHIREMRELSVPRTVTGMHPGIRGNITWPAHVMHPHVVWLRVRVIDARAYYKSFLLSART